MNTEGFTATSTPKDITADLAPGCYLAQVKGVLYYTTSATAPARTATTFRKKWFRAEQFSTFTFRVGPGLDPVWVTSAERTEFPDTTDIVIARTGA